MIVTDVNSLVYAFRPEYSLHESAVAAITKARASGRLFVLGEVAVAFLRLARNSAIHADIPDIAEALAFIDATAIGAGGVREAGRGRWHVFQSIAIERDLKGNDLHDGLLAAACLDMNAAILTADKGFLKYPGLRVHLLTPLGVVEHVLP